MTVVWPGRLMVILSTTTVPDSSKIIAGTNNRVESNKINDAPVGVDSNGTGAFITGNTFVNTVVPIQ